MEFGDLDIKTTTTANLLHYHSYLTLLADISTSPVIKQSYALRCADVEAEIAVRNARIVSGAS